MKVKKPPHEIMGWLFLLSLKLKLDLISRLKHIMNHYTSSHS